MQTKTNVAILFSLSCLFHSWIAIAGDVSRTEILRYAYLSDAPYFFSSKIDLTSIHSKEREILANLLPPQNHPLGNPAPAVEHIEVLTESPAKIIVSFTKEVTPTGEVLGEIIFGIRGSTTLNDYIADLGGLELYGKKRIKQCLRFNQDSLKGIAPANIIEPLFNYLPDCSRAATSHEAAPPRSVNSQPLLERIPHQDPPPESKTLFQSVQNIPHAVIHSLLKDRLIQQYVRPIGEQVDAYLRSDSLGITLAQIGITRVKRMVFVGHSLGGFTARAVALNYSNQIGGFRQEPLPFRLPHHAESVGFNVPGLTRNDYELIAELIEPLPPKDLLPFIESQHLTVGHQQDLILAMGNVREKIGESGLELALEPDGSSFIIPLTKAWFTPASRAARDSERNLMLTDNPPGTQSSSDWIQSCGTRTRRTLAALSETVFEQITGIGPKNFMPHDIFELIHSLENIEESTLTFTIYSLD